MGGPIVDTPAQTDQQKGRLPRPSQASSARAAESPANISPPAKARPINARTAAAPASPRGTDCSPAFPQRSWRRRLAFPRGSLLQRGLATPRCLRASAQALAYREACSPERASPAGAGLWSRPAPRAGESGAGPSALKGGWGRGVGSAVPSRTGVAGSRSPPPVSSGPPWPAGRAAHLARRPPRDGALGGSAEPTGGAGIRRMRRRTSAAPTAGLRGEGPGVRVLLSESAVRRPRAQGVLLLPA
ncbi:histone RNA hairpin-binding protein isoform X2 [Heterocephalus glaber]|uniref:Histone RNA hairpin-binding protein isoform X2 n=1 Tax=Heterocephalus glaber TaxID=10181 RepID=A0AAX6T538_HETGA|nr:histone RNA hairpin-binding protein isoform X2 [Heterocephalus glaber]